MPDARTWTCIVAVDLDVSSLGSARVEIGDTVHSADRIRFTGASFFAGALSLAIDIYASACG